MPLSQENKTRTQRPLFQKLAEVIESTENSTAFKGIVRVLHKMSENIFSPAVKSSMVPSVFCRTLTMNPPVWHSSASTQYNCNAVLFPKKDDICSQPSLSALLLCISNLMCPFCSAEYYHRQNRLQLDHHHLTMCNYLSFNQLHSKGQRRTPKCSRLKKLLNNTH